MQKTDVLFINPGAATPIFQSLGQSLKAIEPPIWASLLANHMRKYRYQVQILDADALNLSIPEVSQAIKDVNPRLVAVMVYGQQPSASTQNMYPTHLLLEDFKSKYPEIPVLLIGGHVSALPEQTLREEKCDFVCQGEGPQTLRGLLENNLNPKNFSRIPGLFYRLGKDILHGPPASIVPQEKMQEEYPGQAWDLLPMDKYRAHNWHCFGHVNERTPYASVYTGLGCPFKCHFCCIHAPFGSKASFRYWDPAFMIKQFDLLAEKYNVRNIKIADEMFVLNEKHFLRLCELIIEHRHHFNIWAYARVDTVKESHLETLKKAGVNWLALGIESGSKYVRHGSQKGRFTDEDIVKIVEKIKAAGIYVIGNYIFGLPDDTVESMHDTLKLSLKLNCEMGNFYSAMAYPGSELYHWAVQEKRPLPESWVGYSQYSNECLPLGSKHLTPGQVLSFRDQAFDLYFAHPPFQQLILEKFGQETLDHITSMLGHKLKRKYVTQQDEVQVKI
jgi:anaerobic magnesium-protoporphyrin IX monomethyl ester cyclase